MRDNILGKKLWMAYESLTSRNGIASFLGHDFRDYFLGLVAFKYLSEKLEIFVDRELSKEKLSFEDAWEKEDYKSAIETQSLIELGYFIEPRLLFKNTLYEAKATGCILENLDEALKKLGDSSIGKESEEDFANIFEDVDLYTSKLGKDEKTRNSVILETMRQINGLNFNVEDEKINYLGDAYEYLIHQISNKYGRESFYYTPKEISSLLAKIVSLDKDYLEKVYDPTCGSASTLLELENEINVGEYFAQEIDHSAYNMARMNMILHGIDYRKFDIELGDTLENPIHMGMTFDAIVSNPPASASWSADEEFLNDERFSPYNILAPKSKADYAFIQHMIHHLDDEGTMAVAVPLGVLYRGSREQLIRKTLIENNYLDAVIGLPNNLFYSTSIPVVILVFKKQRNAQNILFIDASKDFEKKRKQNKLRSEDIDKIMYAYNNRQEIENYSANISLENIRENDYNLNIPRYIDTYVERESVDVDKLYFRLGEISAEIKFVNEKIKESSEKLNINLNLID